MTGNGQGFGVTSGTLVLSLALARPRIFSVFYMGQFCKQIIIICNNNNNKEEEDRRKHQRAITLRL
jgi:hypothetical protein